MFRTRFAPSPTGSPHIGNIRTAVFEWLAARHYKGKLIVRLEDTDRARTKKGSVDEIKKSLEWLGLDWDEGLGKEGKYGPYVQSKRTEIYKKHAFELVKKNKAYKCYCTKERLEKLRNESKLKRIAFKYDKKCLLDPPETQEGTPYVIRLNVPESGVTEFDDLVRGKVQFANDEIDDSVLLKSDGFPTYHLANVVDDHLMEISHVIRAEEWLPSTPKHLLMYKAFGWSPPKFVHLPMVVGKDRSKLSKRHGDVAFLDYCNQGYLPEAMLNFLVFLGWNPKSEREFFTKEELIKTFTIDGINKAASLFNIEKLDWINGKYIRNMPLDEFAEISKPFLKKNKIISEKLELEVFSQKLPLVLKTEKERVLKLIDLASAVEFYFKDNLEYEPELLIWKKSSKSKTAESLKKALNFISEIPDASFTEKELERLLVDFVEENNLDNGTFFWPIRSALSGSKKSPNVFEMMQAYGKEKSIERIQSGLNKLK